ncbi:MAG: hypothetical protein IPJ61_05745 [Tessaracoccus sp.]|uniref:hypothetical protein n=1 Tax=Tessaracoccus sp. TaxID=1971211 RepID=UPI001ED0AFE9|nr:hypothetical protein [Tessaracoccus sp.]MBK7820573.1 hypothetical protein [Tessaracoccus sp.]
MVLFVSHTHLFRGARLRGEPADVVAPTPVQVVFSDGAEVDALLEPWEGDRFLLSVAPYTTSAGTALDAKTWLLKPDAGDEWGYAVADRLDT